MRHWNVEIEGDGGTSTTVMTSRELRELPQWFQDGTVKRVTITECLDTASRAQRRYGEQLTLRSMTEQK